MNPPARARRRRALLASAAAAAAVLATAVSLVIVRGSQNARVLLPCASTSAARVASSAAGVASSAAGVPPYYVALTEPASAAYSSNPDATFSEPPLVVGLTFTGERLATVPPPPGTGFTGVTGAADDRTFVVGTAPDTVPPGNPSGFYAQPRTWYLLRLSPGATPVCQLTRLPIPVTPAGTAVAGIALSPDGAELALALQPVAAPPKKPGQEVLRVYSVATGAVLRSWYGPANAISSGYLTAGTDNDVILSWADGGRELAFNFRWTTGPAPGLQEARDYQLRTLDLSRPGQDLLADSRVVWSTAEPAATPAPYPAAKSPLACFSDLVLTSDGSAVVCGALGILRNPGSLNAPPGGCAKVAPWNDRAFLEYSAATGELARVIGTWRTSCPLPGQPVALLWSGPSGTPLIGYMPARTPGPASGVSLRIAVFTASGYQPLPDLPQGATPATTAW